MPGKSIHCSICSGAGTAPAGRPVAPWFIRST
jgi:hypothetical protein